MIKTFLQERRNFRYACRPQPREKLAVHFQRKSRGRSLSLPLPPQALSAKRKQKTKVQTQSSLLKKLPAELRLIIWEYAIADETLHILEHKKHLCNMPCEIPDKFSVPSTDPSVYTGYHKCEGLESEYGRVTDLKAGANLLPLLRTCRLVYTEAVDVLYSRTIFRFENLDTLAFFSTATLPHRFNSIGYLHLLWVFRVNIFKTTPIPPDDAGTWQKTCDLLASMDGLIELDIELATETPNFKDRASRVALLQSMKHIKAKRRFDVTPWANWPWLIGVEGIKDMPFRVVDARYYGPYLGTTVVQY